MHLSKYETVHHFKEKWGKESGIKMQIVSSYDIFRTNVVQSHHQQGTIKVSFTKAKDVPYFGCTH